MRIQGVKAFTERVKDRRLSIVMLSGEHRRFVKRNNEDQVVRWIQQFKYVDKLFAGIFWFRLLRFC